MYAAADRPPWDRMGAAEAAKGLVIDLAHASAQTINDCSRRPPGRLCLTHPRAGHVRQPAESVGRANGRHLRERRSDRHRRLGNRGRSAHAIARAIVYAINVAGFEYVALGSDFDARCPRPSRHGFPQITQALLTSGWTKQIEAVIGGNVRRLLTRLLP